MDTIHPSIRSMTGFGEAEIAHPRGAVRVQMQSVNSRKGLDLSLNLPESCADLEHDLREALLKRCSRGRITVSFELTERGDEAEPRLLINQARLKAYKQEIDRASRTLGDVAPVSMEYLLKLPGVLQEADRLSDSRHHSLLPKVFHQALAGFDESRHREGLKLAAAILRTLNSMVKLSAGIAKQAPQVPRRHAQLLKERLKQSGIPVDLQDDRIARELALYADRCDISEELTRLQAHFDEFKRVLASPGPHGRKLDFLVQELFREINTAGNKANDIRISRSCVTMKADLEKIREQIQNIE